MHRISFAATIRRVAAGHTKLTVGVFEFSVDPEPRRLLADGSDTVLPVLFKKKTRLESLDWRERQTATHVEKIDGLNCSTDDQCPLSIFGPYITFPPFRLPG